MRAHHITNGARVLFWLACAALLVLSLLPPSGIPSGLMFWDKAQHALGFALLTALALVAAYPAGRSVLGLVLLGVAVECLQALTPWRHADLADWLADVLGIAIAYGAYRLCLRKGRMSP